MINKCNFDRYLILEETESNIKLRFSMIIITIIR